MSKIRKRVLSSRKYTPQWKGFIEGFVVNFLNKNCWRVAPHMEYQDCMQEAQYTFLRLKNKYGNLDRPQHFMALFRTTWTHEFDDLATLAAKYRLEISESQMEDDYDSVVTTLHGDSDNDGVLAIMIEQAPSEVKLVLQLFITAPVEVLDMFSAAWKKRGKHKEYGNNHLNEILGLEPKTDIVGLVHNYFVR